jgi:hypothetical protein
VVLGYSPMIDRERAVTATRLTVFPARPDVHPWTPARCWPQWAEVWPEGAGRVSLNVVGETLLHDLLLSRPNANLMVEVPAFMACDLAHSEGITGLYARGNTLLLKGRPLLRAAARGAAVLQAFHHRPRGRAPRRRTAGARRDAQHHRISRPACARWPRWKPAFAARRRGRAGLADRRRRQAAGGPGRASPTWPPSSS